jgi:hypothetical protein
MSIWGSAVGRRSAVEARRTPAVFACAAEAEQPEDGNAAE